MTIMLLPGQSVADLVVATNRSCPDCGGRLRRWGHARWRVVRNSAGDRRLRPGRVRCGHCGATHVVLPAEVLVRRRDAVAVITEAWRLAATGVGVRRISGRLGVPMETVRGWLRRLRARARIRYGSSRGSDRDRLGWTWAHVVAEADRAGWTAEPFVAYRSQGRLLCNTDRLCNTDWP
jgi:transposase-like protein